MKEQIRVYNAKTGEIEIKEIIVEEIEEDVKENEPSVDEKIKSLQNVDTEHEMAIVELANMIIDIIGGGNNA